MRHGHVVGGSRRSRGPGIGHNIQTWRRVWIVDWSLTGISYWHGGREVLRREQCPQSQERAGRALRRRARGGPGDSETRDLNRGVQLLLRLDSPPGNAAVGRLTIRTFDMAARPLPRPSLHRPSRLCQCSDSSRVGLRVSKLTCNLTRKAWSRPGTEPEPGQPTPGRSITLVRVHSDGNQVDMSQVQVARACT